MKDDLQRYREARMKRDPKFANGYEEGYQEFKLGVMLKIAREQAGLTQEQVAKKLRTNKSAISRIERHSKDMRLSTLHKYAKALGKRVTLDLF
jgi:HTH-type transcriptional regulator / antitoxin HipB